MDNGDSGCISILDILWCAIEATQRGMDRSCMEKPSARHGTLGLPIAEERLDAQRILEKQKMCLISRTSGGLRGTGIKALVKQHDP